ncbi:MAG: PmoA family protein [Armatimonadota bacterium]
MSSTPQPLAIVVSAPNRDYSEAPVSVAVPAQGQCGCAALKQLEPAADVPCQVAVQNDEATVTWIVRDLKKGDSRAYELSCSDQPASAGGVTLEHGADDVRVDIDGELFTRYYYRGVPKPVLWPIIGPTGKSITRVYPMQDALETERDDHHHHRGLFFTHGDVNGTCFWSEGEESGRGVHREFLEVDGGPVYAVIKTANDWMVGQWAKQEPRIADGVRLDEWAPVGEPEKLCEDEREIVVYRVENGRLLDFTITMRATEKDLVFGDTKEGSFGIRVAGTMKVTSELGGRILNARGDTDDEAWGKQAEWCDYHGPVNGDTVGVAILDHPSSFRHPTHWHVRTYGLFAVNPFGLHDYLGEGPDDLGNHTVPQGETVTFKYRIFIHEGDTAAAGVEDVYGAYTDPPVVEVQCPPPCGTACP